MPRRSSLVGLTLAFAVVLPPHNMLAQRGFTLEQVMSAPFSEALVAAPTGGAVAWVVDSRGARNVWAAVSSDFRGRQLTSYTDDDGQEITDLAFTPDARAVVYVRGGPPNRAGERPNPAHILNGVDQAIWIVTLDAGAAPRKLADGANPQLSPDGRILAFTRSGQIWTTAVDGGTPTQLMRIRGGANTLRWSPDGSKLAFVSGRERHAFVGVYDVGSKAYRYLDASVDNDGSPIWSPDGRSIAFVRRPTSSNDMIFLAERTGDPWSIRVADVATGRGREVWRARAGAGSVFHEVTADDQLAWAAGDRLVFPWEGDGWTHLYAVPAAGGAATLLTPGAFEVEHVALSGDRASVVFSSNQGDIDRRHIWQVSVAGGAPTALTHGSGLEWSPVPLGDGQSVALLHSDARTPSRVAIRGADGALRDLVSDGIPAEFPASSLVEPRQVIFRASDGVPVHGQLFLPADLKPGERRPAAIFFHGGSRRQMLLGFHYMYYYNNSYRFNQYLANQGYVVLSVNYRSGIGYGMEFREALAYGAGGASEFKDVLAAGQYLRSRADVDPRRIGLWGGSYGGYLTAMGLSRASNMFAAGVDIHGVHNWNPVIKGFIPAYDSVRYAPAAKLAYESSPLFSTRTWRSPVLLIHGDDDRNVPFTETTMLVEALRRQGVPFEQLIFPDDVHDFLLHRNWMRAYEASAEFFDRKLRRSEVTAR